MIKLYNTMSRQKEEFVPLVEGEVGFYICGPTVYNHIHIGNARTFISFDVIRRYLEYRGYLVRYVQNITDVDDKIINRAAEEGVAPAELAQKYTEAFIQAMDALSIKPPTVRPKATEELAQMIELIEQLIANGHAYEVDGDVYFAVRSYPAYGLLSGRDVDQLISGARVEVDQRKRDALDFALWKAAKPGEPQWQSPWGPGRPGWHIECSAMSRRYLGRSFDIHGGGEDLVFPHHENEIAQSRAGGDGFARYWLHGGMLNINAEKMSKSLGNFLLLKDVLGHVRPQALRLLMLQSHYRSPFDYSDERLAEAESALGRVENSLRGLDWAAEAAVGGGYGSGVGGSRVGGESDAESDSEAGEAATLYSRAHAIEAQFVEQMDDDFNTAAAVALVFDLISEANSYINIQADGKVDAAAVRMAAATIRELLGVLGIELGEDTTALPVELVALARELAAYGGSDTAEAAQALIDLRAQAREAKDWQLADAVRDQLTALGLTIEDTAQGTRVFAGTK